MKSKSIQFELPGAEAVFSLAGEVCAVAQPAAQKAQDATPFMFSEFGCPGCGSTAPDHDIWNCEMANLS